MTGANRNDSWEMSKYVIGRGMMKDLQNKL